MELMDKGMRCLVEKMGTVDAEKFIAAILKEQFDYTQWQRVRFDQENLEKFNTSAAAWAKQYENEMNF